MSYFFSKTAEQSKKRAVTSMKMVSYAVLKGVRTRSEHAEQKKGWDSGTVRFQIPDVRFWILDFLRKDGGTVGQLGDQLVNLTDFHPAKRNVDTGKFNNVLLSVNDV